MYFTKVGAVMFFFLGIISQRHYMYMFLQYTSNLFSNLEQISVHNTVPVETMSQNKLLGFWKIFENSKLYIQTLI